MLQFVIFLVCCVVVVVVDKKYNNNIQYTKFQINSVNTDERIMNEEYFNL